MADKGIDYATVVMAIIFTYAIIYWFVWGKKVFEGVKRVEDAGNISPHGSTMPAKLAT